MHRRTRCELVLAAGLVAALTIANDAAAQTPQPERPRSQVPTLGRPTKPDDPAPVLDFWAYFKGAWNVTWDYPESPIGPADVLIGTTTYRQKGDHAFEALTEASNAAGAFTVTEAIEYAKDTHAISRTVTDSRGFTFSQTGTVAGDLGGQFTIRLEGAPFTLKGDTVRVNSVMRLLSPLNYRTQTTIAVGNGPFMNYGNPWWRRGADLASTQAPAAAVPVVAVTGCLTEPRAGTWTLSAATEPTPSVANGPPAGQAITGPTTGKNEFSLIGVSQFDLPSHKGHTVLVKGLLIKATPASRVNVTSVTMVAATCPAPPK